MKRVKYRKPVREVRKKIADLFNDARHSARSGFCTRASAEYNEAVGLAHRKGVEMPIETFYRMKTILRRCRTEYGHGR